MLLTERRALGAASRPPPPLPLQTGRSGTTAGRFHCRLQSQQKTRSPDRTPPTGSGGRAARPLGRCKPVAPVARPLGRTTGTLVAYHRKSEARPPGTSAGWTDFPNRRTAGRLPVRAGIGNPTYSERNPPRGPMHRTGSPLAACPPTGLPSSFKPTRRSKSITPVPSKTKGEPSPEWDTQKRWTTSGENAR